MATMATHDFWELLDTIDRALSQVNINRSPDSHVTALLAACRALQLVVTHQQEQIVDLNSRVEYGYTRREVR